MLKINANSTDAISSDDILLGIGRHAPTIGDVGRLVLETDTSFPSETRVHYFIGASFD